MITNAAISATTILAERLNANNVTLEPFNGTTPLSELLAASYVVGIDNADYVAETSVCDIVCKVGSTSGVTGADGRCRHDEILQKSIEVIGRAVQVDIHTAKNIVGPIIQSAVDTADKEMKVRDNKAGTAMAVLPDMYEDIWSSPTLASITAAYDGVAAMPLQGNYDIHPSLPADKIISLLRTGSARFDTEVAEFVDNIGSEFVVDLYERVFLHPKYLETDKEHVTSPEHLLGTDPLSRKRTLLMHLMARGLSANVLDDIDMPADVYSLNMITLVSQSGRVINRVQEARDEAKKENQLIVRWPVENSEYLTTASDLAQVVVNMDVYGKWLEDGGCPEILFGSAITDRNREPSLLIEKAEYYKDQWAARLVTIRSMQRSREYSNMVDCIGLAISREIVEASEDILQGESRGVLHERLQQCIGSIDFNAAIDMYGVVREIVCHVMFSKTNAMKILKGIDLIGSSNPDYSIREASLLTIIDIVTDWVANLITDTKATNNKESQVMTHLTIANAVELIAGIIESISGNDISNRLSGELMSGTALYETVAARLQLVLSRYTYLR